MAKLLEIPIQVFLHIYTIFQKNFLEMKKTNMNWHKPAIYFLLYLSGSSAPNSLKEIQAHKEGSGEEVEKRQKNFLEITVK